MSSITRRTTNMLPNFRSRSRVSSFLVVTHNVNLPPLSHNGTVQGCEDVIFPRDKNTSTAREDCALVTSSFCRSVQCDPLHAILRHKHAPPPHTHTHTHLAEAALAEDLDEVEVCEPQQVAPPSPLGPAAPRRVVVRDPHLLKRRRHLLV